MSLGSVLDDDPSPNLQIYPPVCFLHYQASLVQWLHLSLVVGSRRRERLSTLLTLRLIAATHAATQEPVDSWCGTRVPPDCRHV